MASIEDRLVELINSASTEVDGNKKVDYWCQMKELASNHGLLYNFFQDILTPSLVICFNLEGTKLLCGGGVQPKSLELWSVDASNHWHLTWSCRVAQQIQFLRYSPDSTLFCSAGKSDKLVKVWYETRTTNSYTFIYLKHPEPVTSLEWRRTGRFTPRGAVANVLMTSCEDNRVRLWVQTSLPDLVNFKLMPHFHLAAIIEDKSTPLLVTHWINNKEMHITRSLETLLQEMLARILKDNEQVSSSTTPTTNDLDLEVANDDTLTAESSKKLRHKLCRKINKQRALAASGKISTITSKDQQRNSSNINISNTANTGKEDPNATGADNNNGSTNGQGALNGRSSPTSLADEFDKTLESLLKEWRSTTDLIFSINKTDGALTSWQIKYLDGEESGALRQVQVEIFACLKSALPIHDATTMSNITAYSPTVGTEKPNIFIVTQHVSGTLGLWKLNLEQGIELVTRITGLPISPEWLRDGVLTAKFNEVDGILATSWIDALPESHQNDAKERKPFTGECDYYKASQLSTNLKILPQYHLMQLVELLAFGKLQRVKAILNHLVNCLAPGDKNHAKKRAHRSRTYSLANQSAPSFQESLDLDDPTSPLTQTSVEEIELDYVEVTSIKPLTLHLLLKADVEKPNSGDGKLHHAHEEFSATFDTFTYSKSTVDETLDEILGKSTLDTINKQKELKRLASEEQGKGSLTSFNPKKAKLLTHILTHTHIPGLTNIDQMHLLAVADAVAFFDASPDDLNDLNEEESDDNRGTGLSIVATNIAIDSLDDRGLRFLTAMRQYVYLTKCLPMKQRAELRTVGIGTDNIIWAFHSETQDELIGLIPCLQRNKPEWPELREFGVGWWLKKLEVLRKIIEKVAQSAYQARQDPLDAALFYLAMKKKTLVCALLRRTACDKRLLKLFEQDFNDPVNRKKALKNAYALLGLHRFEHAAAFFLLAGSIWDAVEVCINNLNDIQLAIVLIRLNDSDANLPSNLKRLLFTEILGARPSLEQQASGTGAPPMSPPATSETGSTSSSSAMLGRRQSSGVAEPKYSYDLKRAHTDPFLRSMAFWKLGDYLSAVHTLLEGDVNELNVNASIFNFYRFLKDQPLVVKHKSQLMEELELRKRTSPIEEDRLHFHRARSLSSGELGFDGIRRSITMKQSSTEFEVLNETTRLVDKYSDEAVAENERRLFFSTAHTYLDSGCPLLALEVLCSEDHLNMSQAQRMKFIACLHILLDELNTLAQNHVYSTKGNNSGGKGDVGGSDGASSGRVVDGNNDDDGTSGVTAATGTLGRRLDDSAEDDDEHQDFSAIFQEWFERNMEALTSICSFAGSEESILRTMLTYCSLHFADEESLNLVRSAVLDKLST